MAEVKKNIDTFKKFNTKVYALSVDATDQSQALVSEMQLPFDLLCDTDKKVINLYHLLNPFEHGGIAYPAVFIITPQGKIIFRSLDGTATRVNLAGIISFLENFNSDEDGSVPPNIRKIIIIPFPKTIWQISRNMIFRGNFQDWKHYFMFPINSIKIIWKKIRR